MAFTALSALYRDVANAALETVSLAGGEEALRAIADYLDRWEKKNDKEMKRRGVAALRRLSVDAGAIARVIQLTARSRPERAGLRPSG